MSTPKLFGSTNLISWTERGELPVGTTRVVFNGTATLVAIADSLLAPGVLGLFYSTDYGTTWTEVEYGDFGYESIAGLDYVNGKFLAMMVGLEIDDAVYMSEDGISWTPSAGLGSTASEQAKFFYFKNKICCISSIIDSASYFHELIGETWVSTLISGEGVSFIATDDTIAVNDDGIAAILGATGMLYYSPVGNDSWQQKSPDGYVFGYKAVINNGENFIVVYQGEGNPWTYIISYDFSTIIPSEKKLLGLPIGVNSRWFSVKYLSQVSQSQDNKVYDADTITEDDPWEDNSTGITAGVELKQLLGPQSTPLPLFLNSYWSGSEGNVEQSWYPDSGTPGGNSILWSGGTILYDCAAFHLTAEDGEGKYGCLTINNLDRYDVSVNDYFAFECEIQFSVTATQVPIDFISDDETVRGILSRVGLDDKFQFYLDFTSICGTIAWQFQTLFYESFSAAMKLVYENGTYRLYIQKNYDSGAWVLIPQFDITTSTPLDDITTIIFNRYMRTPQTFKLRNILFTGTRPSFSTSLWSGNVSVEDTGTPGGNSIGWLGTPSYETGMTDFCFEMKNDNELQINNLEYYPCVNDGIFKLEFFVDGESLTRLPIIFHKQNDWGNTSIACTLANDGNSTYMVVGGEQQSYGVVSFPSAWCKVTIVASNGVYNLYIDDVLQAPISYAPEYVPADLTDWIVTLNNDSHDLRYTSLIQNLYLAPWSTPT